MVRVATLALVLAVSLGAQEPKPVEALDGLDPVILVQGKEVFGKADFTVVRGRFEYRFSSPETKAAFERSPDKFEIQLGGLCARMGGTAYGNPADYVVHDGRIYIFGSDACHQKFAEAPAKFLPRPAPPMDSSDAALSKGRTLVERAVQALGGADRLDAVATYIETSRQTQPRGQEQVVVTSRTMWKFPGAARQERSLTMQGREMNSANVLSPSGAWFVGQQGAFPVGSAGLPFLQQEFGREIVPLLKTRKDASFQAAAIAGNAVRIRNGAVDVTLKLDAGSGRIVSATFVDRNMEGEIGETVVTYSDYRDAGGLSLPFSRQALFNGAPHPGRTRTIDAITVNEPLADALFAPAAGRQ